MFDLRLRRSSLSSSSSLSSLCRLRVGGTQGLPPFYCRKEFNGKISLLNLLRASEFKSRWNNCERNIPLISCRNVSRLVRWTFHKSQQEFPPHPCITENWEIHKNGDRNKKKKERKGKRERRMKESIIKVFYRSTSRRHSLAGREEWQAMNLNSSSFYRRHGSFRDWCRPRLIEIAFQHPPTFS